MDEDLGRLEALSPSTACATGSATWTASVLDPEQALRIPTHLRTNRKRRQHVRWQPTLASHPLRR